MTWDEGLEGGAREIAGSDARLLRVEAGPGTGKTFALRRRVVRLLEEGADPRRLLAVTFTRNAARNLVEEIRGLGVEGADDIWAGTLHAFCFSVLSRHDVLPILGRVPRPLICFGKAGVLQYEAAPLLQDLDQKEVFGDKRARTRTIRAFEAAWARLQSETPGWPTDPHDRQFHDALLAWLRFHEAILIGELVPETLRFLRANPVAPEHIAFDHVMVDEYQDLNRAEQALLDLLAAQSSLVVVGDEDQSIYRFRFAHPDGIRDFPAGHPGTVDKPLNECRRCCSEIVDLADSLILRNHPGEEKGRLIPHETAGHGEAHIVQWRDMDEEAAGIGNYVLHLRDARGIPPGEILVLSPRRLMGYRLRDAFVTLGIPTHSFYHEEALDDESAQRAFGYLTLLARPDDRAALRYLLGWGSPSWLENQYRRLRQHCETSGEAPWQALERLLTGDLAIRGMRQLKDAFGAVKAELDRLHELTTIQEIIDRLFPLEDAWSELLRTSAMDMNFEEATIGSLHARLRESVTEPEVPQDSDMVRIMSLHKSKGLTSSAVIVAGCVEGLIPTIPGDLSAEEKDAYEREQRRLFYVAMTRGRRILVFSSVQRVPLEMAHRVGVSFTQHTAGDAFTISSRFLSELGPATPVAKAGHTWLAELGIG